MQQKTKSGKKYVRDNNCNPKYFKKLLDDFEEAIHGLENAEILYSANYKIKVGSQQFYDENWEAIEEINHCTSPVEFLYDPTFGETVEACPELGERYISLVKRLQRKKWDWLETKYYLDIDYDYLINYTYYIMSGMLSEDILNERFDNIVGVDEYINEQGRNIRRKREKDSRTVGGRRVVKDSDTYVLKLSKKLNEWDEFTIRCYKNGKYYEPGTDYIEVENCYRTRREDYAAAWEEAKAHMEVTAKQLGLTVKIKGTVIVAE